MIRFSAASSNDQRQLFNVRTWERRPSSDSVAWVKCQHPDQPQFRLVVRRGQSPRLLAVCFVRFLRCNSASFSDSQKRLTHAPRNFCKDEDIPLQLRYTALPPASDRDLSDPGSRNFQSVHLPTSLRFWPMRVLVSLGEVTPLEIVHPSSLCVYRSLQESARRIARPVPAL